MRVVLDRNILARATPGSSGPARELVQRCALAPNVIVLSSDLLDELSRVLRYERLRRLHGLPEADIDEYVSALGSLCVVASPAGPEPVNIVPGDPDDNPVVIAAISGQAEVICTLDRHLRHPDVRAYCARHGIRVMTDLELLELLRQAETDDTA